MLQRFLLLFVLGFSVCTVSAQLQSPDAFLGYKVGTRYTPHWKIVNYFNQIAAAAPQTVKLQLYGQTNEGRTLLVAFISSADNISNLENIRKNNLRLAGLSADKMAANEAAPAIVWLSYNVHGNETSSSEAALMTLWSLVDPANNTTKEWLKNTLVVIDPCINPDGRDRYVNWFNSIAGKNMNPNRIAREHREPWPGGRVNHYNFDLNRDWAWQTQVESQQRVKLYDQWLPQVHADYHEQGINNPYYFAPAAQPYHEVITPWQREFQQTIGRNNARYFDANGWLYYTREVYDLYYPSYGDTYPIYNGSIGMTNEQGGGPQAGLGVLNDEGDTLTLLDRATHHFTTSLSIIEASSLNAPRLLKEFRKFFSDGLQNGVGEYKTYVIRNEAANSERIASLLTLLDKNQIQYGTGTGAGKGFNYATGKEEPFTVGSGDIIVSSFQPRSALVKVLFEPKPKLVDSATYDISAWSLPYAYGLNAWASRDRINVSGAVTRTAPVNVDASYGYVMPWKGVQSAKVAGQLLQKGVLLRYSEEPFEVNGNKFERGSVLILRTANKTFGNELWSLVKKTADANGVQLYPVTTGFVDKGFDFGSGKVHPFRAPRVAMLTGEGVSSGAAGEIWHFFDQQLEYPLTLINANDVSRINWSDFDVLIMPDGNYRFLGDKSTLETFRAWISKGGHVVALESAVGQLARAEFGIKTKKDDTDKKDSNSDDALKAFADRERDAITGTTPGAIFRIGLDNTHPLAYGYPDYYYTLKMDDNIYEYMKNGGWNVGVLKKDNILAGFVGTGLQPKLKDGLLFGVQDMDGGTVTYLSDDIMFRSFWENGKLMLCNAVFLVGR